MRLNWNLESVDGNIILQTSAGNLGPMAGTLTVNGIDFNVSGHWADGKGVPGRNTSCFEISGQHAIAPNLPIYLGAAGKMIGTQNWPQSVEITGGYCSSVDGTVVSFHTTLLPMMSTEASDIAQVYAESGCILMIDTESIPAKCSAGFLLKGTTMTPMSGADLQKVCTGTDPVKVTIPKSAPANKPVSVIVLGEPGHFINPPLKEAHYQVAKILEDANGYQNNASYQGLVLEYKNESNRTATQTIVFNERPDPMTHTSVVIRPN
jgi:hypothetical protein